MLGNPDDPEQRGVIPRSLEQIFEASQALNAQGWSFRIQVHYTCCEMHCFMISM